MVGILTIWIIFVNFLQGEDAILIELFHLHATGTMHYCHWSLVVGHWSLENDAHMGNLAVMVVEEHKVARARVPYISYRTALRRLLRGITQQVFAEKRKHRLGETRAVHAQRVLAAP